MPKEYRQKSDYGKGNQLLHRVTIVGWPPSRWASAHLMSPMSLIFESSAMLGVRGMQVGPELLQQSYRIHATSLEERGKNGDRQEARKKRSDAGVTREKAGKRDNKGECEPRRRGPTGSRVVRRRRLGECGRGVVRARSKQSRPARIHDSSTRGVE